MNQIKNAQFETLNILYQLYEYLNKSLFGAELPKDILINIQYSYKEGKNRAFFLGRPNRFRIYNPGSSDGFCCEIAISYDTLQLPWADVSESLLHEMCHYYQYSILNISPSHNNGFQEVCEKHGLKAEIGDKEGEWNRTSLTEETRALVLDFLKNEGIEARPRIYRKISS